MEQILLTPRELKRYEMVQARLKSGCKIEKILSDYNISRKAFYSNLHKFEKEGIEGLKSKWGLHRKTEDKKELEFEKLFKAHPYLSSYEFSELISLKPRTIQRIIERKKIIRSYMPKKERRLILEKLQNKKK
jgi:transposase